MKSVPGCIGLFVLVCLSLYAAPVAADIPGGGIAVIFQCGDSLTSSSCNANGGTVYINDYVQGTISGGFFEIAYDDSFTTYRISKDGYYDKPGTIDLPAGSSDIIIDATLTQKPTGSGVGYFTVYCSVDGASVAFDGITKGTISGGSFTYQVSTTATPYTSYTVSKSGYETYYGTISTMPADSQTIYLSATLTPVVTTTQTPIGGSTGYIVVSSNVNGASVYFDSTYKGTISNGQLSVLVYTTGTPSTTYRVEKSGYVTATGSLPTPPTAGQTKYITVNLNAATTQAPAGSGKGTYTVHSNVDGAEVYIDGIFQGITSNNVFSYTVATTGTPVKTYEVRKTGYTTYTGTISQTPANGQTIDLYATLNPAPATTATTRRTTLPTTTPTPLPTTKSPLPLTVTISAVLVGALILVAGHRKRS